MPNDNQTKIEEIMEIADEILTEWERDFMESISQRDPDSLTEKQQNVLDKIYDKACRSPY